MQKLACITGLLACVPGLFGRLAPCVPGLFGRLDSLVSQGSLDVSIAPPVSQGSWDVSIPETSIEPYEISPNEPCVISPASKEPYLVQKALCDVQRALSRPKSPV